MSHEQVSKVLAFAKTFDNRQVDELTIESWRLVIGHLRFDDAMQAVALHRRDSTDYLEPAHVVANAKKIAANRHEANMKALRDAPTEKRMAPKPKNFDAMVAAWNDPVAFAREVAIYNRQLEEAGHPPIYTTTDPRTR